jgi:hypothetical protein
VLLVFKICDVGIGGVEHCGMVLFGTETPKDGTLTMGLGYVGITINSLPGLACCPEKTFIGMPYVGCCGNSDKSLGAVVLGLLH